MKVKRRKEGDASSSSKKQRLETRGADSLTRSSPHTSSQPQVSGHMTRLASRQVAGSSTSHSHGSSQSHASCQQDAAALSAEEKQAAAYHSNTSACGQEKKKVKEELTSKTILGDTFNFNSPEITVIKKEEVISETYFHESSDTFETETVTTKIEINQDICFGDKNSCIEYADIRSTIIKAELNYDVVNECQAISEESNDESSEFFPIENIKSDPDSAASLDTFEHKQDVPIVSRQEQRIVSANVLQMPDAKLPCSGSSRHTLFTESKQRNVSTSEKHNLSNKNTQKHHLTSLCQRQAEVFASDVSMVGQSQATDCQYVLVETQSEDASSAWQPDESEMSKRQSKNISDKSYFNSPRNHKKKLHFVDSKCCNSCNMKFKVLGDLKRHLAAVHNLMSMCKKCHKIFVNAEELEAHSTACKKMAQLKSKPVVCDICGKLLHGLHNLRAHKALLHKSEPHCKNCQKFFPTFELSQTHGVTCTVDKERYRNNSKPCGLCSKIFHKKILLRQHMASFHNSEPFCKKCQKFFFTFELLQTHLVTCTVKNGNFVCDVCIRTFRSNLRLRFHMAKYHHKSEPFCNKCYQLFVTTSQLQAHVETCKIDYKHNKLAFCGVCNQIFARIFLLRIHNAEVHKSEHFCRPCKQFFTSETNKTKHVTRHRVKSIHNACDTCHKHFPSPFLIRFHKASVHNSEPFCKECQKILRSSEILQAHGAKCTGTPRHLRS